MCTLGGSPREKQKRKKEKKKKKKKKNNKKKNKKKKGRGRQNRKTEAACVASAGCNNLLIVYHISIAPRKIAPGTMESRPLRGRRQGGSAERLPQRKLMRTLGGSLREKQKRTE